MKTIYFVRHGQSEGNAGEVWVDGTSPLSDAGKEQAQAVAERIVKLPVDLVVSSPMLRTKETAEIIAQRIGKQVAYSDFFVERRHPSFSFGRVRSDPDVMKVYREIRQNFHVSGYRYSDEENFDDFKVRALAGLNYLAERDEKNILVVTHGFFLRILIAAAIFGENMLPFGEGRINIGDELTAFTLRNPPIAYY